jgi:hypothetical protein
MSKPRSKRADAGELVTKCAFCAKPITPDARAQIVRVSRGPAHAECYADNCRKVTAMIAEATAAGRHSSGGPPRGAA